MDTDALEYQLLLAYRSGYVYAVQDLLEKGLFHSDAKIKEWLEKYGEVAPRELFEP